MERTEIKIHNNLQQNIDDRSRADIKSEIMSESDDYTTNSDDVIIKRTPKETEDYTEAILADAGYINGNEFPFHRVENGEKSFLEKHPGNQKGDQKPDKYKFDSDKKVLFIVEDKNYGIEKNINSLVNNISNQAIKRIKSCLDTDVPAGVLNNKDDSHIDRITITFSVDLKGHYFHTDNTPVTVEELRSVPQLVMKKVASKVGKEKMSQVNLRFSTLLNSITNKPLDFSYRQ